jgi:uncharacterized damage-inducible protein DinB
MTEQIIETWEIHNRINLYLLAAINANNLSAVAATKGRTVGEQFAHIHNVRLMWLKEGMPSLLATVEKLEKDKLSKELLQEELTKSGFAIAKMLEKALEDGKLKGFKPHPMAFLGYIISHESHHRGQIVISLKQAGCAIDKKTAFGLWEWGTK